jgi:hypothetical protein
LDPAGVLASDKTDLGELLVALPPGKTGRRMHLASTRFVCGKLPGSGAELRQ